MYLSTSSIVSISNSEFAFGKAIYGGAIYVLGNSQVDIKSTDFHDNQANQGAAIHATTYATFSVSEN